MMGLIDRENAAAAADRLKAFAQPQRLMILAALIDVELAVGAIDAATGIGQPALSQQLAELRRAELVAQRRKAKQVLYRLADERVAEIVRFMEAAFAGEGRRLPVSPPPRERAPDLSPPVASAAVFAVVESPDPAR